MNIGPHLVTDVAIHSEHFRPAHWENTAYVLVVEPNIVAIGILITNLKEWVRQLEVVADELKPHTA